MVRLERVQDIGAVRMVNLAAFEGPTEANLVDRLRDRGKLLVSMVAELEGTVVGHIAFSPVTIEAGAHLRGAGLGPMAVTPAAQRSGVGSHLVRAGLAEVQQLGCDYGVVLGHPDYYPRFGFAPASRFGLRCRWDVPEGVFMALELREDALAGLSGMVSYQPEFDAA